MQLVGPYAYSETEKRQNARFTGHHATYIRRRTQRFSFQGRDENETVRRVSPAT